MRRYRTLVVDDEPMPRRALKETIEECPELLWVGEADDLETAIDVVKKKKPEVIFLDIKLRGTDGFKLLRKLKNLGDVPAIILNTGFDELEFGQKAINKYKDEVLMILKKPFWENWIDKEDMILQKIKDKFKVKVKNESPNYKMVRIKSNGVYNLIPYNEISHIITNPDHHKQSCLLIHTSNGEYKCWMTVKEMLDKLDSNYFLQVERGCIINKTFIREFLPSNHLRLSGVENLIKVGSTKRIDVIDFMNQL